MTDHDANGQPPVLAAQPRGKRVGYLELFFDLVFVFAITQLASLLHHDHTIGGWGRAGLVLWLIWWAWSQYAWAGNAIELERRGVRVVMLAVTGAMLLAAAMIPTAFEGDGVRFALPYAAVRLIGLALYWSGLRDQPAHRAALTTFAPVAALGALLVIAGGWASSSVRPWWWLVALLFDAASLASAGRGEFRVEPAHFAERHGLIVIIALGESVIAVGATAADLERTGEVAITAALGFVAVAALWWAYFDWAHGAAERRLATEPDHRHRGHLARDLYTIAHLPIVGGIVVFSAGIEEALVHTGGSLGGFGGAALVAGPAAFLVGLAAIVVSCRRQVGGSRSAKAAANV